jgi:hypothetical protein
MSTQEFVQNTQEKTNSNYENQPSKRPIDGKKLPQQIPDGGTGSNGAISQLSGLL